MALLNTASLVMKAPQGNSVGRTIKLAAAALAAAMLAGCVRFHPEPISSADTAAAFERRSLTNASLKAFLETNLHREFPDWPHPLWDFDMLTCAASYYHPDLDVARAGCQGARAGIKTAGGRPNPTLG